MYPKIEFDFSPSLTRLITPPSASASKITPAAEFATTTEAAPTEATTTEATTAEDTNITFSDIDKMLLNMAAEEAATAVEETLATVPGKGKEIAEDTSEKKDFVGDLFSNTMN